MKKAKDKKKITKAAILARVIGGVWALLLVAIITAFVSTVYEEDYYPNVDYILDNIEKDNLIRVYSRMTDTMTYNIDEKAHPEYRECIGITDYVRNYALYNMYEKDGDKAKQEYYKELLSEAKGKMGKLDFLSDDIDKLLEVK